MCVFVCVCVCCLLAAVDAAVPPLSLARSELLPEAAGRICQGISLIGGLSGKLRKRKHELGQK